MAGRSSSQSPNAKLRGATPRNTASRATSTERGQAMIRHSTSRAQETLTSKSTKSCGLSQGAPWGLPCTRNLPSERSNHEDANARGQGGGGREAGGVGLHRNSILPFLPSPSHLSVCNAQRAPCGPKPDPVLARFSRTHHVAQKSSGDCTTAVGKSRAQHVQQENAQPKRGQTHRRCPGMAQQGHFGFDTVGCQVAQHVKGTSKGLLVDKLLT
jgi:hypothetical protein